MKKETEISTYAQQPCVKYASKFTEEKTKGVNSLQTSSSTSTQIWYCAKLDWPDDAVAVAESKYEKFKKKLPLITFGLTVLLVMLNIIRIFFV